MTAETIRKIPKSKTRIRNNHCKNPLSGGDGITQLNIAMIRAINDDVMII